MAVGQRHYANIRSKSADAVARAASRPDTGRIDDTLRTLLRRHASAACWIARNPGHSHPRRHFIGRADRAASMYQFRRAYSIC